MGHMNYIFKIILVIQLLTCALAFYGHPDTEIIDFRSPTQSSPDQLVIEAAIKRGMDGEAVAELLRTKKPVVRTTTRPGGFTKTTTYKLEPDGSISSKSILKYRQQYVYNSDNIPDSTPMYDLRKSPTGTVTRTFTDSDGSKVTQTIAVSKPKPSTVLDEDELSEDWFNKPFPSWPEEAPSAPTSGTSHRTITRTFTGPNGERRTVQSWSSDPKYSEPEIFTKRTSTRTYVKPKEEKHVVHTTSSRPDTFDLPNQPKFPTFSHTNWPGFDYPSFSQPWDTTDPEDSDDWKVVKDSKVETTTKTKFESWTPKSWEWPEFPTHPTTTTRTTTTTTKPKQPKETSPKPSLPNLEDFLRSEYGSSTKRAPTPTTKSTRTQANTPKSSVTTTTTSEPKIIKIEDLPIMEILHNGKPANEAILKNLPPHLTPRAQTGQVLKIEHKFPIEDDIEVYTPKVETNIRTYSKTHIGPEKPSIKDLDPQMQDVLRKAGISPDDITNIEGDTITKTRTEPDGRIITTTYKVNTVPSSPVEPVPARNHYMPPQVSKHTFSSYKPITPITTHLSPISEFLAKLGLTKLDITSRNGHYTKTFIDDNGEVLTATFVLSSPKGVGSGDKPQIKPLK